MQFYDFLMIGVLAGAAIFGAMKGLAWQIASVASMVVSYMAALKFRDSVAPYITAEAPWNRFGAMLAIFIATSLAIWVLFRLVHDVIDRVKLKEFDRQIGFLVGAAKGVLYCVLITFFVVTLWPDMRDKVLHSHSGLAIAKFMDRADAVMPAEVKEVIGPYLDKINKGLDPDVPTPKSNSVPSVPGGDSLKGSGGVPASILGGVRGAIDKIRNSEPEGDIPDAPRALGEIADEQGSAAWPNAPAPRFLESELPAAPMPRERSFYDR
jgi:membrane protein required for colicin V production